MFILLTSYSLLSDSTTIIPDTGKHESEVLKDEAPIESNTIEVIKNTFYKIGSKLNMDNLASSASSAASSAADKASQVKTDFASLIAKELKKENEKEEAAAVVDDVVVNEDDITFLERIYAVRVIPTSCIIINHYSPQQPLLLSDS